MSKPMQPNFANYLAPKAAMRGLWWLNHKNMAICLIILGVLCFWLKTSCDAKYGKQEPAACSQFLTYWQEGLKNDAGRMLAIPTPLTEYMFGRAHILEFYPPTRRPEMDRFAINGGKCYISTAAVERQGSNHVGMVCLWINDKRKITDVVIDDDEINYSLHH